MSSELSLEVKVANNPLLFNSGQTIKLVCDQRAGAIDITEVYMQGVFIADVVRTDRLHLRLPADLHHPADRGS